MVQALWLCLIDNCICYAGMNYMIVDKNDNNWEGGMYVNTEGRQLQAEVPASCVSCPKVLRWNGWGDISLNNREVCDCCASSFWTVSCVKIAWWILGLHRVRGCLGSTCLLNGFNFVPVEADVWLVPSVSLIILISRWWLAYVQDGNYSMAATFKTPFFLAQTPL